MKAARLPSRWDHGISPRARPTRPDDPSSSVWPKGSAQFLEPLEQGASLRGGRATSCQLLRTRTGMWRKVHHLGDRMFLETSNSFQCFKYSSPLLRCISQGIAPNWARLASFWLGQTSSTIYFYFYSLLQPLKGEIRGSLARHLLSDCGLDSIQLSRLATSLIPTWS